MLVVADVFWCWMLVVHNVSETAKDQEVNCIWEVEDVKKPPERKMKKLICQVGYDCFVTVSTRSQSYLWAQFFSLAWLADRTKRGHITWTGHLFQQLFVSGKGDTSLIHWSINLMLWLVERAVVKHGRQSDCAKEAVSLFCWKFRVCPVRDRHLWDIIISINNDSASWIMNH